MGLHWDRSKGPSIAELCRMRESKTNRIIVCLTLILGGSRVFGVAPDPGKGARLQRWIVCINQTPIELKWMLNGDLYGILGIGGVCHRGKLN